MIKKLLDVFNFNKIIQDNNKLDHENFIQGVLEDVDLLSRRLEYDIFIENCSHDWVNYDDAKLNRIANDLKVKTKIQLDRISTKAKIGPLSVLDSKMLQLLIVWSPPTPRVSGKCMMCDKTITVIYINDKEHIMMY